MEYIDLQSTETARPQVRVVPRRRRSYLWADESIARIWLCKNNPVAAIVEVGTGRCQDRNVASAGRACTGRFAGNPGEAIRACAAARVSSAAAFTDSLRIQCAI